MEKQEIIYIPTKYLHHHPDNPRQDYGDLSELTESIRQKGVMQNLTVVQGNKVDGYYTYIVVIGNRRLEAAKAVGLTELPCIVADLSKKEQMEVMLIENIQRTELTPYEQACGFQMLLDLGDSIDSISEKTGFSSSTIRRKVKLAELDPTVLKNVKQITIDDMDRLNSIKDVNERNKVLKFYGTNNFEYKLSTALQDQSKKEKMEKITNIFKTFAEELKKDVGYNDDQFKRVESFYSGNFDDNVQSRLDAYAADKDNKYFFFVSEWGSITLYREAHEEEIAAKNQANNDRKAKEEEYDRRKNALRAEAQKIEEIRTDFIKNLSKTAVRRCFENVVAILLEDFLSYDIDTDFHRLLEDEDMEDDEIEKRFNVHTKEDFKERYLPFLLEKIRSLSPEKVLLYYAYSQRRSVSVASWNYYGSFYLTNDESLELLKELGYEPSDAEQAFITGKSDLYLHNDGEEEDDEIEDDEDGEDYEDIEDEDYEDVEDEDE